MEEYREIQDYYVETTEEETEPEEPSLPEKPEDVHTGSGIDKLLEESLKPEKPAIVGGVMSDQFDLSRIHDQIDRLITTDEEQPCVSKAVNIDKVVDDLIISNIRKKIDGL